MCVCLCSCVSMIYVHGCWRPRVRSDGLKLLVLSFGCRFDPTKMLPANIAKKAKKSAPKRLLYLKICMMLVSCALSHHCLCYLLLNSSYGFNDAVHEEVPKTKPKEKSNSLFGDVDEGEDLPKRQKDPLFGGVDTDEELPKTTSRKKTDSFLDDVDSVEGEDPFAKTGSVKKTDSLFGNVDEDEGELPKTKPGKKKDDLFGNFDADEEFLPKSKPNKKTDDLFGSIDAHDEFSPKTKPNKKTDLFGSVDTDEGFRPETKPQKKSDNLFGGKNGFKTISR